jgi:hypothetical protein
MDIYGLHTSLSGFGRNDAGHKVKIKGGMTMKKDIESHIKETWFPEHKATLTEHGELKVLQWAKPGTSTYYCRYVFDGSKMYISGDIGTAVFWLTWRADVHSFNDIHVDYFEEKLEAYSGDRRNFDSDKAVKRLKEWVRELKGRKYDREEMRDLFNAAENCSSRNDWADIVNNTHFISDLDSDYWDWIYEIGDEIPSRIIGYLIGLKMASGQLNKVLA